MAKAIPDIAELSFKTNPHLRKVYSPTSKTGYTRFMNLPELFEVADACEFGILAANCFTPEMIRGVCKAAFDTGSPVIIQVAESQINYALSGGDYRDRLNRFSEEVVGVVHDLTQEAGYLVPIGLHLDHLQKNDYIARMAAEAGFTSIELDYSRQDTKDRMEAVKLNAKRCEGVMPYLHELGIAVEVEEGEIGDAAAREAQTREEIMREITRPEYAVALVERTNPEALAIFIGSAHGEFKDKPVIVYSAVGDVRRALRDEGIDVPIVLHGGTGQTYEGFRTAIHHGTRKINYASRWWTILQDNLESDPRGNEIIGEMKRYEKEQADRAGKEPKGPRYVFKQFREQLYKDVDPDVFKKAEWEIYRHAVQLITQAFGSANKARLYEKKLRDTN